MLKLLLKVRLMAWLAYLSGPKKMGAKPGKVSGKGRLVLFGILYLYLIVVFLGMFFAMFSALAAPLYDMGLGWFYFSYFVLIAFAMMFVFSVFTAKAQLFEAKDNELLLSMPIAPSVILASRMMSLLLLNLGFELLVALPAAVAWCMFCPVTAVGALSYVLICAALPFFSMSISALFGWILALISARVRRKSLVSTAFSLVFLAAYFYVYSNINTILTGFLTNAEKLAESFSAALPLVWLGKAAAEGEILNLVPGLICLILPFVIVYAVLSRTFIRTATTRRGGAKVRYVKKEARVSSPFGALLRREGARLLSSSAYIMNSAMGAIMNLVAAVLILVKGKELLAALSGAGEMEEIVAAVVLLGLCAMASMTTISACSVSLEGKNLWIVRSMPVAARTVLRSKLALHLIVSAPGLLLAQIASIIAIRPDGLMTLWILLLPQIFNLLMSLFGQWANLCHPRLDWQNEAQPVKQGAAVAISMFGGMGLIILPALAGLLLWNALGGIDIVAAATAVIFAAAAALLYKWCMGKGAEIFDKL